MAQRQVAIRVSVAWWLRWYLAGVTLMCRMTGCQPNIERVMYWVRRSIRMRIE
ncbi:MAG: hypothetical protein KUL86_10755 [Castellaniella sp.]|nr:hypothetical protein [Castellaniella sp.]